MMKQYKQLKDLGFTHEVMRETLPSLRSFIDTIEGTAEVEKETEEE